MLSLDDDMVEVIVSFVVYPAKHLNLGGSRESTSMSCTVPAVLH